jgi:monoamine oxidase
MANELNPESLCLSTPVIRVEQSTTTGGSCIVRSSNGIVIEAKKVILSIASPLYKTVQFTPPLPAQKQRLATENKLGYYAKMIFVFNKPWWRNAGLSGEIQFLDQGPILSSVDTSIPDDDQWSISCFIVGRRGLEWSQLSEAERRSSVWNQLRSAFEKVKLEAQQVQIAEPIDILDFEWTKQEFFHGGPCPASPPGLLSSIDGSVVREPFGNVHFIGTETALEWKGYMEGAVRSGDRGAEEVIATLRDETI